MYSFVFFLFPLALPLMLKLSPFLLHNKGTFFFFFFFFFNSIAIIYFLNISSILFHFPKPKPKPNKTIKTKRLKTHDLGDPSLPAHSLVVNWLPCAMCFGSVVWSGIRRLVVAGMCVLCVCVVCVVCCVLCVVCCVVCCMKC